MIFSQLAFSWLPDNPQDWAFEIIGIVASLLVFASFFWSNERITRIVNMAGCVIFVIYAVLIQSLSVCIINGACFILHIVKLVQMRRKASKGDGGANAVDNSDEAKEPQDKEDEPRPQE